MTDKDTKPSLEKNVMDAIHSGRVHMRPRWKFVLSGVLAGLGALILVCTLLFIMSFAIFMLRQSGALFVPVFGMRGVFAFFAALPAILVVLLIVFLIVLEILVRRYRVGYRMPLLVSVLLILVIVFFGGYVLERTRIHEQLLHDARMPDGLPPPIAILYRSGSEHIPDIYHGTIIEMSSSGFVMSDDNGAGTTTIIIDRHTELPLGSAFQPGDEVVVFGTQASDTVHALGVVQEGSD